MRPLAVGGGSLSRGKNAIQLVGHFLSLNVVFPENDIMFATFNSSATFILSFPASRNVSEIGTGTKEIEARLD